MNGALTTTFVATTMRAYGYHVEEGPDTPVCGGAADSRTVRQGELFTAFTGEHHDGNRFVSDALQKGAVAAISAVRPPGHWPAKTLVIAPNPADALGKLANAWRAACGVRVVGITGTVGKTTTKELTAATLSERFRTHRSPGNLNSREGLPLALLSLRRDHDVSVLEIAMDSPGEIAYLCEIANPDVGIVLNIGLTHVEKLGSFEAIAEEKLTLARYAREHGTALVNIDDPRIAAEFSDSRTRTTSPRVVTFGAAARAQLRSSAVQDRALSGTEFRVTYGGEHALARCATPGTHIVPGALAAIGAAIALGLPLADAVRALSRVPDVGRARTVRGLQGVTIIDDRYNSSPLSVKGALSLLKQLQGRRIAVLGRMAELGEFEGIEHRDVGTAAATACDVLLAVGPACKVMAEAASHAGLSDVRWFATRDEATDSLRQLVQPGDCVLIKASRGEAFETIVASLENGE